MAKYFLGFLFFATLCVVLAQSRTTKKCSGKVYNVLDYGAAGNGKTDDTNGFKKAWSDACKSSCDRPTVLVPHGKKFLLQPVVFSGSCNSKRIIFHVAGTLQAPKDPDSWKCKNSDKCKEWITFHEVNGLYINGNGTIDPQGSNWWDHSKCKQHKRLCGKKPTGLIISHSTNVHISGLTLKNPPQMHMAFESSNGVYASHLTIKAPADSPNTDGIHTQHTKNVHIHHSHIGTGDDCVSIGEGSSHVNITHLQCGPGHGISIGSLGKNGDNERVEYVHVKNATLTGTTNGVRIKTWQGGSGVARKITFEDIKSVGASNPIIIDQSYRDHKKFKDNSNKAVKISDITYKNVYGTSNTDIAVQLGCSKAVPCTNIIMNNVDLSSAHHQDDEEDDDDDDHEDDDDDDDDHDDDADESHSVCSNAHGHAWGKVHPRVPCLSYYS